MFRNCLDGKRDMYLARLRDGKVEAVPHKAGNNSWNLKACPMDGGGMALDNGKLITAWRREDTVFVADGEHETAVGHGKDVAIAAGRKGRYVAWSTEGGIEASVPGASAPVSLSKSGGFVTLGALPDGSVLAAWEDGGAIVTKRLN
jgi:hypothetical protein